MGRILAIGMVACLAATGVRADPSAIWDGLHLDELIGIMAEEGRAYGEDLAEQLFERGGGPTWRARVARLYDADDMAAEVRRNFEASFGGVDTAELEAFLTSDLGRRIARHEIDARRAFLDPQVEAAASESAEDLQRGDPRRHALIEEFIETNDLVENNVAASLTFTYAFNLGLAEGGMESMTRSDALSDAWAQEEQVREDTRRWLDAQLSLAFAPLGDDELRRYVELSRTEAGKALNAALFQAFEPTFTRIARELGEGVARSMRGRDL